MGAVSVLWLADTCDAVGRGWRPWSTAHKVVVVVACILALIPGVAVVVPAGWRWLVRRGSRLALLCGSAIVALLLTEGVFWVRFGGDMPYPFEIHLRPQSTQTVFHPDLAIIPGVSATARFTVNRAGVRGRELPEGSGVYRILCLGGSTTECLYLDDTKAWPRLLEQNLSRPQPERPVWVGNGGVSGLASVDHLRFLLRSTWLQRVDAVVLQTGVNDLTQALNGINDRMDGEVEPRWARSRLFRSVLWLATSAFNRRGVKEDHNAAWHTEARARRQRARIVDTSPALEQGLGAYEHNVRALVDLCRSRHVRAILLSQPLLWHQDLPPEGRARLWFGWLRSGEYVSVERLREAILRYNDVTRRVCAAEGAEFVDLAFMDGNLDYFYDDCHLTETGAARVASTVAEVIRNPRK